MLPQLSVSFFSEGGLFPCSSILVQETLRSSLVDLLDRSLHSSFFVLTGLDCNIRMFDLGSQSGTSSLILLGFGSDNLHALFGGFNIGHGHTS